MRKPLLLLVDDDPAVLSALEAEFEPEFGQIVKLVAYDDPRAVLESLPRWHEERRTIAAAIVDQRMPGLTGVELISALRRNARSGDAASPGGAANASGGGTPFHPARHMRAALLTAYAGLESALAARNEANVDRYIEKPWVSRTLLAMVRKLLERHVAESGSERYLEFRELSTVDEIRRHLAMRYEVYSASPDLRFMLPEYSRKRLDMDAFDPQSRFFAMFNVGPEGAEQVGGLRLIGVTRPDSELAVVLLASQDDYLRARAARPTPDRIELPESWPDTKAITQLLDLIRARGEGVVEASRLVFATAHPSSNWDVGQVALGLFEGAATYVFEVVGVENALQSCAQTHQGAWARLGFRLADGTAPTWSRRHKDTQVVLHGRESHLTEAARERIRSMGRGARARGAACRCATLPQCLGVPYETGEFRNADLFCPRVASDVLAGPARTSGADGVSNVV